MKKDKRDSLKIFLATGGVPIARWIAPVVSAVSLPAHAQTSSCNGDIYTLQIEFTGVSCGIPSVCDGLTDQEIIDQEVKPGPTETFCITDQEIAAGEFDRSIDFDGNGQASDFLGVLYTIDSVSGAMLSGTVETGNVDTGVSLTGTWNAAPA